jgi:molybdate transport system ATP-binding protein
VNDGEYIVIKNCRVSDRYRVYLRGVSWTYSRGETWLVTGGNGSGKEHFVAALGGVGKKTFAPEPGSAGAAYESAFAGQSLCVSLEEAAALIAEERRRDESDYAEGGVDIGRTAREYLGETARDNEDSPGSLDRAACVKLAGIEGILDRGLKYLSTGEIRRVMLARALLSGKKLLALSEPFAGLDAASRGIMFGFLDKLARAEDVSAPRIVLCADRYDGIPPSVNRVLEFRDGRVSFNGTREGYESLLKQSREPPGEGLKPRFVIPDSKPAAGNIESNAHGGGVLIDMKNVNVAWGGNHVLKDLSWRVERGGHWFIRGPNGSGKTTLLELITGDNMQVFSNEVYLFGARRGSGETLWDIREKLGIVSYRLHLEYRMVGGTALEDVVISGFHDSIGLYESATDFEKAAAAKWLSLAGPGFQRRKREPFSSLSYGEQRALLILRATVKSAPLLILDEPCHGLDDGARALVLGLLETIAAEGASTVLHVTHDPSEMLAFEKNILELRPGETPMYKVMRSRNFE